MLDGIFPWSFCSFQYGLYHCPCRNTTSFLFLCHKAILNNIPAYSNLVTFQEKYNEGAKCRHSPEPLTVWKIEGGHRCQIQSICKAALRIFHIENPKWSYNTLTTTYLSISLLQRAQIDCFSQLKNEGPVDKVKMLWERHKWGHISSHRFKPSQRLFVQTASSLSDSRPCEMMSTKCKK